jgi:hypothetical protein
VLESVPTVLPWTWSAFGLRVVRVTHDVWVRPLCRKRVLFAIISLLGLGRGGEGYGRVKNRNMVSRAAVRGGLPLSATRFLSRRFANRCRADTSGPLRKLSNLAVRRASSRSSSGGNNFLRTRLSALSRSLSLSTCLRPYLEGQGHWSDLWISYIATRVMSRGDAISAPAGRADIKGSHRCSLGAITPEYSDQPATPATQ